LAAVLVDLPFGRSQHDAATRGSKQLVYVSPFVGSLDDHGEDGMDLVRNIKENV
jgi:transaldolase